MNSQDTLDKGWSSIGQGDLVCRYSSALGKPAGCWDLYKWHTRSSALLSPDSLVETMSQRVALHGLDAWIGLLKGLANVDGWYLLGYSWLFGMCMLQSFSH